MHSHGIALQQPLCSHRRETWIGVAPVIAVVALLHALRHELASSALEFVEVPV